MFPPEEGLMQMTRDQRERAPTGWTGGIYNIIHSLTNRSIFGSRHSPKKGATVGHRGSHC